MLQAVGSIVFEIAPLNVDQVGLQGGADFAEKAIMGRRPGFEFMGSAARELTYQGRLFPEALGGEDEWRELEQIQASGVAQHVIRGDGLVLGWFQIVGLRETHRHLDGKGVPRMIDFEITLRESDAPPAGEYQGAQLGLIP